MSRLLMVVVSGGNMPSYRKLVVAEDPVQFHGMMMARALKDAIDKMNEEPLNDAEVRTLDDSQATIIRTLKVKLYDMNLEDYPETDEEVAELYRRFDAKQRG